MRRLYIALCELHVTAEFFKHEIQLLRLVAVEYAQCDIVVLLVGRKPRQP